MKKVYLFLAVIGFILPTILVIQESMVTGNILLYVDPVATAEAMFANRISSIFAIDLLFAVVVFFIWSYTETQRHHIQKMGLSWVLTMLFGLAGGFPLFLYFREQAIEQAKQ